MDPMRLKTRFKKMNVNKSSEIMILIMLVDINVDLVKKPVFNIL